MINARQRNRDKTDTGARLALFRQGIEYFPWFGCAARNEYSHARLQQAGNILCFNPIRHSEPLAEAELTGGRR